MAENNIDKLQIEIEASSTDAAKEVNRLADAMKNLKSAMGGKFNNPIKDIQKSTKSANESKMMPKDAGVSHVAESKVKRLVSEKEKIGKPEKISVDTADVSKAEKRVSKLTKLLESIKRIAFYRVVRSGIKAVTEGVATGVKNLYEWSSIVGTQFKPAMDSLATSALYAKNSLGAMIGPILEALAPAVDWLTDKFAKATEVISQFYAALTGRGYYYKAIKQSTEFAKETKEAAKAAKSFMIGIDELNVIDDATGGVGKETENFKDMFEKVEMTDDIIKRMKTILEIVELIGAALAAWAIGKRFGLDLVEVAGLALGIYETIKFIQDIFDMWRNGVNMDNLLDALKRIALAALGAYIAFGKLGAGVVLIVGGAALFTIAVRDIFKNGANLENALGAIASVALMAAGALMAIPGALGRIVAGVILVVGGITLFVAGFKDASQNGVNFYNTMLMVAGILSAGIGISVLTKSWIPLLITAIAAAGLAIAVFAGNGQELVGELQKTFSGFSNFIKDVFVKQDMEAAGEDLKQIAEGVVNSVIIVFESAINLCIAGINNLIESVVQKINKFFDGLPEWITKGKSLGLQAPQIKSVEFGRVNFTNKDEEISKDLDFNSITNQYDNAGEMAANNFMESFKNAIGGSDLNNIFNTETLENSFANDFKSMQNQVEQFSINSEEYMKNFADISDTTSNELKEKLNNYTKENSDFYKEKIDGAQAQTQTATARMTDAYNSMSNNSVSAIGRIIKALNSIPTHITTVHTIITENAGGGSNLAAPAYASGGFPEDGLFFANHGELVGKFSNGKTAVANNQEIVAGITAGVENANGEQNALLREQNDLLTAILAKTGTFTIDGKTLMASVERAQRQRGANIMAGGVMA